MPSVNAALLAPLQPGPVWSHFALLCDIPRVSKHEQALRERIVDWAKRRGLPAKTDAAGNLIIRKPATAGMEDRAGVVLQGHLDMVCQKNDGTEHDFFNDPIRTELDSGWLVARNTTLGSDNGIGVALALAALEAEDIAHGPLEVLLTVDEEAGMGGAQGLEPGRLTGRLMINLDTEEWGQFYLGCAGGLDVDVEHHMRTGPSGAEQTGFRLAVRGLQGGHSGIDIHRGRGHAIKLLVRLLRRLEADCGIRLAALEGGTARNALPREAHAEFAIATDAATTAESLVAEFHRIVGAELAGAGDAPVVVLDRLPAAPARVLERDDQRRLLVALQAAPQGVRRMSTRIEGVVETSDNLGVIRLRDGACHAVFMVRSLIDSAAAALADEIVDLFALIGADARKLGTYPGWQPDPESPLLALCQAVYAREFGTAAGVRVIHAGLECGIIGAKYPDMDMISFGPDIRGAHAPGERVEIASVQRCWQLLCSILAAVPAAA